VLAVFVVTPRVKAAAFEYDHVWRDSDGDLVDIRFDGSVTRGQLAGVLELRGRKFVLDGSVDRRGVVSGVIHDLRGDLVAEFAGQRDSAGVLLGETTMVSTGKRIPWRLPKLRLPSDQYD
jgi:hypothetical protein